MDKGQTSLEQQGPTSGPVTAPQAGPVTEIVTEILEMTVSIERTVFKPDGFPKTKLFQSAKAAVPRRGTPEQTSQDLQAFIRAQLTKLEAQELNGKPAEKASDQAPPAKTGEPAPPPCPVCGKPMKPSKKNAGWYCPNKNPKTGEYCTGELLPPKGG